MPHRSIKDPALLGRILDATLLISSDLALSSVLRHVLEEARSMTGARYCALGVLNEDRTALAEFLTVGLDPAHERLIGARPTGLGVLGLLISDSTTLRLPTIGAHPERFGFPPNHPPMTSFLGVPLRLRDEVYGNLYLTDKAGEAEFSDEDQAVVEALAVAAGIAIENARLHARASELAVLEDRDRLAGDLHDTVIQHLFAVGLSLQSMASAARGAGLGDRLQQAVEQIDATITQIRTTIYGLGPDADVGVRAEIVALVRELESASDLAVELAFEGPIENSISEDVARHLVAVTREALSNVNRHAAASTVHVTVRVADGRCELRVADDGRGLGGRSEHQGGGLGLRNLDRRAATLGGGLALADLPSGGTALTWWVPTDARDASV